MLLNVFFLRPFIKKNIYNGWSVRKNWNEGGRNLSLDNIKFQNIFFQFAVRKMFIIQLFTLRTWYRDMYCLSISKVFHKITVFYIVWILPSLFLIKCLLWLINNYIFTTTTTTCCCSRIVLLFTLLCFILKGAVGFYCWC